LELTGNRGEIVATIALYANKIKQMPSLITGVKKSVSGYKSELSSLRTKILKINSSVCNLEDVISSIQSSSQTQEQKITSLETFQKNSEQFITDVVRTDNNVSDVVVKRKNDFYKEYSYLKPECEKGRWEKFKDGCKKVGQWCKDNWKLIVVIVLVIVAVVVIVLTAGAALGPIMTIVVGACKGLVIGALSGGLIGGLSSLAAGESFLKGFGDGAFTGALTGALFGGLGGVGQVLGNSCRVLETLGGAAKLAKVVPLISKISGGISLGMAGFDLASWGAGLLFGQDNFLTAFNAKLHSSKLYNAFQIGVSVVAAFTGGFNKGMKDPKCFVAGTMILTAAGSIAIENIKTGDKVISTNEDTLETAEKKVLETYIRETTELVHLTINEELISTTFDHPFYVKDRGFVNAGELVVGNVLLDSKSNNLYVENIRIEITENPVTVYNFQVEDFHTYHVGNTCVLVHNASYDEKVARLERYKKQGADFEKETKPKLQKTQTDVVEQITVKTKSGTKTRLDFLGKKGDAIVPTEAKSSATAPLTRNQKIAFPEIAKSGATVVGKGKGIFPGGTKILPIEVDIVRPK